MSHPSVGSFANGDKWTLNFDNSIDTSVFGHTSRTYLIGLPNVTATFNGNDLRTHPELDWIEDPQTRVAVEIGIAALRGEISLDD